ncbi:MAG: VCBS repeat-containing protein [Phycisphaerales bacterium]|nr:VCBS repeat-containing protein [Phycisphaerales bacterium]
MLFSTTSAAAMALCLTYTSSHDSDDQVLADWFGFDGMEVLPVGDDPGPMLVADVDSDGLDDIVVGNNRRSRIEILRQRPDEQVLDQPAPAPGINEFPEHPRWERILVPVQDRVNAIIVHDLDRDGLGDLILGGTPGRITIMLQAKEGEFKKLSHRDVRGLSASPAAFALGDIEGDQALELISIVDGDLSWWPLTGTRLGSIQRRPAGVKLAAVIPADYDGDGLMDIAGISPDDEAPVRIWFAQDGPDGHAPGIQVPFQMPPIVEFEALTLHPDGPARIAVIERPTRRIVLYDVERATDETEAAVGLFGFADGGNRNRPVLLADADGDGHLDVIAADTRSSAITVHHQRSGQQLGAPEPSPTVADVDGLSHLRGSDELGDALLILSTEEDFVGWSRLGEEGGIDFPTAIAGEQGWAPRATGVIAIDGQDVPVIVRSSGRKYKLEFAPLDGSEAVQVDLGSLSRPPDAILTMDADQDGLEDVLLLTKDRPMTLVLADGDGQWTVLEKDDMPQYGLVGAGRISAVSSLDIDGDEKPELLTADRNYIRGLRYHRDGDTPGWQVIEQINADDPDAKLIALTSMDGKIIAADETANALLIIANSEGDWQQQDLIDLHGITPTALLSGPLDQSGRSTILALGEDAMATVSTAGDQHVLREHGTWRSAIDAHAPHELAVGDVNADGHGDMVALDAGEQMLEILTFSDQGQMLHATGFPVFESRLFSGGDGLEYQPRQVSIADVTGDGRSDVILLVHDRVVLYLQ